MYYHEQNQGFYIVLLETERKVCYNAVIDI